MITACSLPLVPCNLCAVRNTLKLCRKECNYKHACAACLAYENGDCMLGCDRRKSGPTAPDTIRAHKGLLYDGPRLLDVVETDRLAVLCGYDCAEKLVKALEGLTEKTKAGSVSKH